MLYRISAVSRATVVLPVPALPENTMCRLMRSLWLFSSFMLNRIRSLMFFSSRFTFSRPVSRLSSSKISCSDRGGLT